eukprot:9577158-Alexandrium_andersonii.AAC.1
MFCSGLPEIELSVRVVSLDGDGLLRDISILLALNVVEVLSFGEYHPSLLSLAYVLSLGSLRSLLEPCGSDSRGGKDPLELPDLGERAREVP